MTIVNRSYEKRIIELENELQQKEKELSDCKKARDEFIDIASHDLKAPMRKLRTFSERLAEKSEGLDEAARMYIQRIEKTVAAMQSLVDGLSALSNIGTEFDFVRCDLNEIMREVVYETADLISENSISVHVKDLPTLDADHIQLKEVFRNLMNNSVKFRSDVRSAEITVSAGLLQSEEKIKFNLPVNKVYFQIKFADNGIGFNQENADAVLKPFERLNGKSLFPGNGLGLAICKKIINMHSGIFLAKGEENIGSVFILILPQIHQ